MKIYHTETQEDYDALMVELERLGIQTLGKRYWEVYENQTVVIAHAFCRHSKSTRTDTAYGSLGWALQNYPSIPITKYKAKADDKMKFTKENVYKAFSQYRKDSNFPFNDLQDEIIKLDDTPEKVAVPKFVAEWIEWNKEIGVSLQIMLLCYKGFYENTDPKVTDGEKAVQWYVDNPYKFIQAYEKGYTIEPEQLYYIPLPHLETSDGIQQVLSKRKGDKNYFASRPDEKLKQRYTKEELEQVPEVYKPYAKPIEEEEE